MWKIIKLKTKHRLRLNQKLKIRHRKKRSHSQRKRIRPYSHSQRKRIRRYSHSPNHNLNQIPLSRKCKSFFCSQLVKWNSSKTKLNSLNTKWVPKSFRETFTLLVNQSTMTHNKLQSYKYLSVLKYSPVQQNLMMLCAWSLRLISKPTISSKLLSHVKRIVLFFSKST